MQLSKVCVTDTLIQQTLCQLTLTKAPGSSATAPVAGRKRRRNRWSDTPPVSASATITADIASTSTADAAIAAVMATFSESAVTMGQQQQLGGTGGQNLSPEQFQQIKEQIEVSY